MTDVRAFLVSFYPEDLLIVRAAAERSGMSFSEFVAVAATADARRMAQAAEDQGQDGAGEIPQVHPLAAAYPRDSLPAHMVVETWADVPFKVAGELAVRSPGVYRHRGLGMWVIVLSQIDPERRERELKAVRRELAGARELIAALNGQISEFRRLAGEHLGPVAEALQVAKQHIGAFNGATGS